VKRRQFIRLIGGAAVGWPLAARAQQPKVSTVGVLVVGAPGSEQFWRLFREGMRELGYIEGQNIRVEFRSDEGKISHLPELAAELVRLKVDVIVTWFTPAARAAKQATREIPVVIALAGNPVENGLVESLAWPGGNVTGMSIVGAELASKGVELSCCRRLDALRRWPTPPIRSPDRFSSKSGLVAKPPGSRSMQ
jgi:putative ABC transport system substrate-binding protein